MKHINAPKTKANIISPLVTGANPRIELYNLLNIALNIFNINPFIIVLYGGSLNSKNVNDILSQPHIDGGLIGGASLKVDEFKKLIDYKG